MAIKRGQKEVVDVLAKNGVGLSIKHYSKTPLDLARSYGRKEIVEILKKHGAK
jgi:ankyrin repeat protein